METSDGFYSAVSRGSTTHLVWQQNRFDKLKSGRLVQAGQSLRRIHFHRRQCPRGEGQLLRAVFDKWRVLH